MCSVILNWLPNKFQECQCLGDILNDYLERCWDIICSFDKFDIRYISRTDNNLTQEASSYWVTQGKFHVSNNPDNQIHARFSSSGPSG
jgi:hypothetical protein